MDKSIISKIFLALGLALILGSVMLGVSVSRKNTEEETHNAKYTQVKAEITNITKNDYTCYEERDCSQCQRGSGLESCSVMMKNNETGDCQGNSRRCCEEECQRCTDDDDDDGETCRNCGKKSMWCNDNCRCSDWNRCLKITIFTSYYFMNIIIFA